ncbi:neurotensin/neuromedin N [Grus japonensis]|uniref:Neurotensin/neuromedin N n=1 Tax=Grus japonensis TaxID=30415 RepID=A0ABC9VUQ2_GRUJA
MRAQLVCVVLLALASCSLCSDSEEEMKALEADLLTNMYTSKVIIFTLLADGVRTPNDELLFMIRGLAMICVIGERVAEEAAVNMAENNSAEYG